MVSATDYASQDITSFLRRDPATDHIWTRETNRWTYFVFQAIEVDTLEIYDTRIDENTLRRLEPGAFVPPELSKEHLEYDKNGRAYINDRFFFYDYFRMDYLGSLNTPQRAFWELASVNNYLSQSLFYFYLEQEGFGWVLDPDHKFYRGENPKFCCQSDSRILCRTQDPLNILKKKLQELNFDQRRVPLGELWESLEPFQCLLHDHNKFIYFIFKLEQEKFITIFYEKNRAKFLQKSYYVPPKRGRPRKAY